MARRMVSDQITDSDAFLEMPVSSRELYFQMITKADDDGFIKNPKSIMRNVKASTDDMNVLLTRKFLINFDSGIIVIKHWRIHNLIRYDRYKPTVYKREMAMLDLKDNKAYTLKEINIDLFTLDNNEKEHWQPNGNQMATQDKLSEVKLSEVKKETNKEKESDIKHKYGSLKNVLLTDKELTSLKERFNDFDDRIENLSMYMGSTGKTYKSHYLTILNWDRKDKNQKEQGNGKIKKDVEFKYKPRRDRQNDSSDERSSDE